MPAYFVIYHLENKPLIIIIIIIMMYDNDRGGLKDPDIMVKFWQETHKKGEVLAWKYKEDSNFSQPIIWLTSKRVGSNMRKNSCKKCKLQGRSICSGINYKVECDNYFTVAPVVGGGGCFIWPLAL